NPAPIPEDSGPQTVALTGIAAGPVGSNEVQNLTVSAVSSNPSLIPNPAVNFNSGNGTGSLTYTALPNANGQAVIIVTVTDDGGNAPPRANSFAQTFPVAVTPVNDPPLINPIPNLAILEDSLLVGVPLAGIFAGPGGETQFLTI